MSMKQRKVKIEPRIKLNHNIYVVFKVNNSTLAYCFVSMSLGHERLVDMSTIFS